MAALCRRLSGVAPSRAHRWPQPEGAGVLPRRKAFWILAGLLLLGGLLRGFYLADYAKQPDFRVPHVDADFHNYWARGLAFGQWTPPADNADPQVRTTPYFRPPGYPYFLAAVYKLTGSGYLWPRLLQAALGLLNAVLAYSLASRWFGRGTALILAGMMSTYWVFIFYEGEFQEPALVVTLILALCSVLMRWRERIRLRPALVAGILIGICGLVRPNALLLLPVLWIWTGWILRRHRTRAFPATAAVLTLGAALAVAPATLRNLLVSHEAVPISTNGGINLYIGNNDRADGLVRASLPDVGVLDNCYDWPEVVSNLERKTGRKLSHSGASRYLQAVALHWMAAHPGDVAKLLGRKTLLFWGPAEPQDNKEVDVERRHSPVLRFNLWSFPLALALGLTGALLLLREHQGHSRTRNGTDGSFGRRWEFGVLLALIALSWYVSYLPFAITSRYRVPVIPILLFFGAFTLSTAVKLFRSRDHRALVRLAVVFALILAPASVNWAGCRPSPARWHYQRGRSYAIAGDHAGAVREYSDAIQANPNYSAVYNDMAAVLALDGRLQESMDYLRRAIRVNPSNLSSHCNLAAIYEAVGMLEESLSEYNTALRIDPRCAVASDGARRLASSRPRTSEPPFQNARPGPP